jgi:hypothetical protein
MKPKPWHRRQHPASIANRRASVDLAGNWRACTDKLPKACDVLGTVSLGLNTGALVRLADTRALVMVKAGEISMLNQRQVQMLIEAATRCDTRPEMVSVEDWEGTNISAEYL